MAYSLTYFKFRKSLEREIRTYWSICVSSEFSKSWINQFPQNKSIIEVSANSPPFSYVGIKCSEFILQMDNVIEQSRENALVNFITAFEVYLFDIMSRIIYLDPSCLKESDLGFSTKDLIKGFGGTDYKLWFSQAVTDRLIRNKQHYEIIKLIAKISKCDLKSIADEIDEWNKWTYVRNAIVHNGRRVSNDLHLQWPQKFPSIGAKLNIPNNELMKVQTMSMTIAKHLEKRINETIIGYEDAHLLVRELFIRFGIDNPKILTQILQKNINYRAKKEQISRTLTFQRKTNLPIHEVNFDNIIIDIERDVDQPKYDN